MKKWNNSGKVKSLICWVNMYMYFKWTFCSLLTLSNLQNICMCFFIPRQHILVSFLIWGLFKARVLSSTILCKTNANTCQQNLTKFLAFDLNVLLIDRVLSSTDFHFMMSTWCKIILYSNHILFKKASNFQSNFLSNFGWKIPRTKNAVYCLHYFCKYCKYS